ncbi:LOW QUALITY PROTEIN: hypothetical protein OSB04_016959 [Centaurea solstitialis]|uniref:Integrase catalytic domain-containing protein n=1 Tax=Centaurea solstitialis TaxID=347529 RepID=A0AA38T213_9ASTR|nr:LOW QUALITY PROTEIN: hypothetical protein OSB04_016959 [Centaurea solstitialis]
MTKLVDYHTLWKNYMTYSQRVFELNKENQQLSAEKSYLEIKIVDLEKLLQSEKGEESENSELSKQITELQQSLSISNAEKVDLLIKVTDLEESLSNERSLTTSLKIDLQNEHDELLKHSFGNAQNLKLVTSLRKENECLQKKVHELDEDKKVFENKLISSHSRVIELSNQVNDFEKIVIIESSNFEKERRAFEAKINELSLKISVFDEQKENKIFKEFSESTCYVNCCYDDDDSNSYDGMNVFDSLESCTDSCTNKKNVVDSELVKIEKMLQDERKVFEEERKVFEKERKSFELKCKKLSKKIFDLERQIVSERKDFEKKKSVFESKKKDLKKKSFRVEKDRCVEFVFEEETKDFEKERKSFEEKSVLFKKKIANLEVQLSDERSAFKRKEHLLKCEIKGFKQMIAELKNKTFDKSDFEEEKRVFEMEIRKLTRNLSKLSSDILKEQIMSSNLKKKLDETVAEKNLLSAMVKDFEDIVFKVNLNEPKSPDVIVQSPYVDYADSVCSFKTAPSSLHADVSSTKSFTPTNRIRPSNLFYDHQIDGSGKNHSKKGSHIFNALFKGEFLQANDTLGRWFRNVKSKRRLRDMTRDGEIVGCKIGLYPRSQVGAKSEEKGKVKVGNKVKNLNLEQHNYHPGKGNVVVDALSRKGGKVKPGIVDSRMGIVSYRISTVPDLKSEIKEWQEKASEEENLKSELMVGFLDTLVTNTEGLKCFGNRIWIPKLGDLRKKILVEAHKSKYAVHPGTNKMYHGLRQSYWWSRMKKDIAYFVERCVTCLQVKIEHQRPYGKLQQLPIPEWTWEHITMDFVTKLPRTPKGYDTIWVVVDRLSKSAHFLPMRETYSMERLAKLYLAEIVRLHGIPLSIVSDRDARFTSTFWQSFQRADHSNLGRHAEGVCLGFRREDHLPLIEFAYNNSYHSSIDVAPYEILYERKCRTPLCWNEVGERQLAGPKIVQITSDKINQVRERLKTARDRQRSYADKRRKDIEFQVGDQDMLKVSPWKGVIRFGRKGKLSPRYIGPFRIVERIGTVAYRLELPVELNGVHNMFHVSNLRKCLAEPEMAIPLEDIEVDQKLNFVEEPVAILERKIRKLRKKEIVLVKIQWKFHKGQEATWEVESEMRAKYPFLFSD